MPVDYFTLLKGDFMNKKMFISALLFSQIGLLNANVDTKVTNSIQHYSDHAGHFVVKSEDNNFSLGFKGLLQQKTEVSYTTKDKNMGMSFLIPKARLSMFGKAFHPNINYFVQTQFEQSDSAIKSSLKTSTKKYQVAGSNHLEDFYVNVGMQDQGFHLRFGKFTLPFSRHYMVSGAQLRSPMHTLARSHFSITHHNKDVGLMMHSGFNMPLEYALAVVSNGLVGRLGYNHKGIDAFELVDFHGGDARFGVGVGGFLHTDGYKFKEINDYRATVDGIFKFKNTSSHAEVYYMNKDKTQAFGANVDVGYLYNKHVEPVVHYSVIKPNMDKDDMLHEIDFGANYYIHEHHFKAQPYVGVNMLPNNNEIKGGVQLQFAF